VHNLKGRSVVQKEDAEATQSIKGRREAEQNWVFSVGRKRAEHRS
jgi:hypothetical protein